jgi:hypothetical protein
VFRPVFGWVLMTPSEVNELQIGLGQMMKIIQSCLKPS